MPRPTREIEIYQPITSPDTMTYAPAVGHKGIYWQQPPSTLKRKWDDYAEVAAAAGRTVAPGEDRAPRAERPRRRDAARRRWPQCGTRTTSSAGSSRPTGGSATTSSPTARTVPFGFQPELEDSMEQRIAAVGTPDDVAQVIGDFKDLLDLKHLVVFLEFPGLTRDQLDEQLHLVAEEVMPLVE